MAVPDERRARNMGMNGDIGYSRASLLLARGFADLAYREARKCCAMYPSDPRHLKLLGETTFKMGKATLAAEYFAKALELTGPNAPLYVSLSECLMALGAVERAADNLARALELAPDHPTVLKLASKVILKLGGSASYQADRGVAVVTGAARGIGRATVERLASIGFGCVALDSDSAALHAFAAEAAERGQTIRPAVADVSDRRSVRAALASCASINVLVNNAAVIREASILLITEGEICDLIMNNAIGAMIVMQEALPKMASGSRIITVGSAGAGGPVFQPDIAHYLAAKGALAGLWGGSIVELAERGIMTHIVQPA
jgi:NADP-dependent 3-hydroxy acid dehydrogenase YdfG